MNNVDKLFTRLEIINLKQDKNLNRLLQDLLSFLKDMHVSDKTLAKYDINNHTDYADYADYSNLNATVARIKRLISDKSDLADAFTNWARQQLKQIKV